MKNLNRLFLSLWGRYFFHVHPGHRVPSCVRISRTVTFAVADPESHAHSAFVDFIADSLDVTWAVQIFLSFASSISHVDYSINSCWSRALRTVKSEIPSPATGVAVIDAELATPVDTQTCVVRRLLENAFLLKGKSNQIQDYRSNLLILLPTERQLWLTLESMDILSIIFRPNWRQRSQHPALKLYLFNNAFVWYSGTRWVNKLTPKSVNKIPWYYPSKLLRSASL